MMTIFQASELVFCVDGNDAATLESDVAKAVEIAGLEAQLSGNAGVVITQHDYWSFTIAVTSAVPFGQRIERREWLAAC
ncbi:hypothetical protein [Arthrobacter sp. Y81]|uniref:hypothetical protein n=1 Tax=Arthrobacter sp. Y81 TaxID=2058897 RepID=UPI0011AFD606|nr:hypothetical protein [Arthrobacter sp. Y81]